MEIDDNLREIDFGQWEGMRFEDIARTFPDRVIDWMALESDFAFPGGERIGDFMTRMRSVAERLNDHSSHTLLLCTHGGVIRSLICHYLGLKPWQYILFKVKPASITTIELFDSGGILAGLSETVPLQMTEDEQ
jgi:broad specificity phosphatase PhoE